VCYPKNEKASKWDRVAGKGWKPEIMCGILGKESAERHALKWDFKGKRIE